MALEAHHQAFWQSYYESGELPWDIQGPSPHFVSCLNDLSIRTMFPHAPARLFVPGAGRGHDAVFFAQQGYQVTCLDLAPSAPFSANQAYPAYFPSKITYQAGNLFEIESREEPYEAFDGVIEHTCFCAIPPSKRVDYVQATSQLLKSGGVLLGVFWEHSKPDGPPFSVAHAELLPLFSKNFDLLVRQVQPETANGRSGQETLYLWRKK